MSIEDDLGKRAINEEHVADMLLLIKYLTDESVNREGHTKIVRKVVSGLGELQRDGYRLNQLAAPPGDALEINDIYEGMKYGLFSAEYIRKKGNYRRHIAWRVAVLMYSYGVEPMATKYGQYENLVEIVLKAMGEKIGGVHQLALEVLPGIKKYTKSSTKI